MESVDNCNPDNLDWADETLLSVIDAAKSGVPSAIKELQKREKELALPIIDTVSSKVSTPTPIIEWIEE